jgi:predicted TIM-barrel fold metal-dependent hydrolase
MIIDCHTHLGRNEHIKATAKELLKSMDKAGIDKALVFAGELNDAPNAWTLEQIAPHRDRLLGVAAAKPQLCLTRDPLGFLSPESQKAYQHDKEEIKKITDWYGEGKIVACKFYTGYEHYYPSDAYSYLDALNKLGCPAIFHTGDCLNSVKRSKLKHAQPLNIDEVAVDFRDMNFIIAHMGYPWVTDAAEVCYKNDNVYSDISGFVYGEFQFEDKKRLQRRLEEFNDISCIDKLLFGTDWPIADQGSYRAVMEQWGDEMTVKQLTRNVQKAFNLKC